MKVIFLKDHEMGSNSFKKGQPALIITSIAKELIEEGVCEENKSVTLRDKIVEASGTQIGEAILEDLPDHATDIVKMIPSINNIHALEHLATDDRVTVREAAAERLEELN